MKHLFLMKFLILILFLFSIGYSQAIAVVETNGDVTVYNYQLGSWVEYEVENLSANRCSFDEDGILWTIGDNGSCRSTDCMGTIYTEGSVPGGVSCDISAHYAIVINPPSCIYTYHEYTNQWQSTIAVGGGEAVESAVDEDHEVFRTTSPRYNGGDSRVVSYNVDYGWQSYIYPMSLYGIYDITVQYGMPIVIAMAYDGGWYKAIWTWNGTYWSVNGSLNEWYTAVDCSINGNLVTSYCIDDLAQQWITYNSADVIEFYGVISDIAVSYYSITP